MASPSLATAQCVKGMLSLLGTFVFGDTFVLSNLCVKGYQNVCVKRMPGVLRDLVRRARLC